RMLEPLDHSRSGEAVPQLVDDARHDAQAPLVLTAGPRDLLVRYPALVGARAHPQQFRLPGLAHRGELRIQPPRHLMCGTILADRFAVSDPREQEPHLLAGEAE